MYKKPVLFQTEDLAEGVYAASGSSSETSEDVRFTVAGTTSWGGPSGQIRYSLTIPDKYIGKNVILTFHFTKKIENLWGLGGSLSVSETTAMLNIWNLQNGEVTVQYVDGDPGLKSISIQKA